MNVTGWPRGLEVTGGGRGVVSHAGLALLRHLADKTGLTGGLPTALATPQVLVHDRGRVVADMACAIADGARVIFDFRVMGDQPEVFGPVPTAWRTLAELARAGHDDDGEHGVAAGVGAGGGAAWRAARDPAGGQDARRRDLHPARCHRHDRALTVRVGEGTRGGELQGI